jgi:hypothetical protein
MCEHIDEEKSKRKSDRISNAETYVVERERQRKKGLERNKDGERVSKKSEK